MHHFIALGSCFAQETHAVREVGTSLTCTTRLVISWWKNEFSTYTLKLTYAPFYSDGIIFWPKNARGPRCETTLTGTAPLVISWWKDEFSVYTLKFTCAPFYSVEIMLFPKNTRGLGGANIANRHSTTCPFVMENWVFNIHLKIHLRTIL